MQWVEVPKRTVFRHLFKVEKPGQKVIWNFTTLKKDIGFGISMRIHPDSDAKGLREIMPVTRYESHKMTVKGSLVAEEAGTYVLLFDNSFSKLTPKRVTFFVDVKSELETEAKPDITGWLLKKKKQKGIKRAWSKRWFTMSKGVVQYFKNPNSYCRGTVDVSTATVAINPKSKFINIDNGTMLLHLKAMKQQDFDVWVEELKKYQHVETSHHAKMEAEEESGDEHENEVTEDDPRSTNTTPKERLEKAKKDLDQLQQLVRPFIGGGPGQEGRVSHSNSIADLSSFSREISPKMSVKQKFKSISRKSMAGDIPDFTQIMNLMTDIVEDLTAVSDAFQTEETRRTKEKQEQDERISKREGTITKHRGLEKVKNAHRRNTSATSFISIVSNRSNNSEVFYDANTDIVINSDPETSDEGEIIEDDDSEEEQGMEDDGEDFNPTLTKSKSSQTLMSRRKALPAIAPSSDLNLFNLLRKNVGKDLSRISMPVSLNEPLNLLQRLCEELEYSELLITASSQQNSLDRMLTIAAFAVSGYASSKNRPTRKPFNPLLGETYECIRNDKGFRFISEKVSHHPAIVACHCEGEGFVFWQDQAPNSKFWGKSMEMTSEGTIHLLLKQFNEHYTWTKVNTCMRNIFSEGRYLEHYGELLIENQSTGEKAKITFKESSYFSSGNNEFSGSILDAKGNKVFAVSGKWNESLMCEVEKDKFSYIWKANPPIPNCHQQYGFTQFGIELNELFEEDKKVLPKTDTRFRPDQRLLEEGELEKAEEEKTRLEEKQREARKIREERGEAWIPQWFKKDSEGNWVYKGGYWETREAKAFNAIDLFS